MQTSFFVPSISLFFSICPSLLIFYLGSLLLFYFQNPKYIWSSNPSFLFIEILQIELVRTKLFVCFFKLGFRRPKALSPCCWFNTPTNSKHRKKSALLSFPSTMSSALSYKVESCMWTSFLRRRSNMETFQNGCGFRVKLYAYN